MTASRKQLTVEQLEVMDEMVGLLENGHIRMANICLILRCGKDTVNRFRYIRNHPAGDRHYNDVMRGRKPIYTAWRELKTQDAEDAHQARLWFDRKVEDMEDVGEMESDNRPDNVIEVGERPVPGSIEYLRARLHRLVDEVVDEVVRYVER